MDYDVGELLSEIPNEIFFNDEGNPDYYAIFVEVARVIYREQGDNFVIPAADFINGRLPNLSTFQRSVPDERKRRAS